MEFTLFEHLGYRPDDTMRKEYSSDTRQSLYQRYHGMGCSQIIGLNPQIKKSRKYFIGVVGGPNEVDYIQNEKEFRKIGKSGTTYYTFNELCHHVLATIDDSPYLYNSAPSTR